METLLNPQAEALIVPTGLSGRAGEEGLGEGWEILGDGYGSGLEWGWVETIGRGLGYAGDA